MSKLNFVLGLALLCVFGVNAEEEGFNIPGGKFRITSEKELNDLAGNVTRSLQKLGAQEIGTFGLIRIHSATYKVVAGIIYELLAEVNENNQTSNCTISLWEKPWENFLKFDVECGGNEKRKYQYLENGEVTSTTAAVPVLGGSSKFPAEKLTELYDKLTPAFAQLSKENDGFNWVVKNVLSATAQIVAGTRYVAQLEIENPSDGVKQCEADIWEKLWEEFFQVELKCGDKSYKVVKQKSE